MAEVDTSVVDGYVSALAEFYGGSRELGLLRAYETGRAAADAGMSMLEIVEVHHRELALFAGGSAQSALLVEAGAQVLSEFLASFEMTHRGYRDAMAELRESHARLMAERDRADMSSAAKTKFISSMSHDMRTPLNAILGYAQLLALGATDEAQQADLAEIAHAGQHLLELINEAIDIGKIEEGELALATEDVALRPLVDGVVSLLRPLADRRGISIRVDVAGTVRADRQRLERVVMNLLSNAIKYNRDRGSIAVGAAASPGSRRLEVADTGWGLTSDDVDTLFVRFHRANRPEHDGVEGSGLGLALCKNLVEAMGGRIGVESATGEGSTFWIELPAGEAA